MTPSEGERGGAVRVMITVGAGKANPLGRRLPLESNGCVADALARALDALPAEGEGWWSPFVWGENRRATAAFEEAAGIGIDIDYYDAEGMHARVPPEKAAALEAALGEAMLGNVYYRTPRGARLVFVFAVPERHVEIVKAAALGACALVEKMLGEAGLLADRGGFQVDRAASGGDLARMFYTPRAIVNGERRAAEVLVLRGEPYSAEWLAAQGPELPAPPEDCAPPPLPRSPAPPSAPAATFAEAAEAWNRDHPGGWLKSGGTCPACGHKEDFGRLPDNPERWACFSANHERDSGAVGRPGPMGKCWTGDALDLEAHRRGVSRRDVLQQDGFLTLLPRAKVAYLAASLATVLAAVRKWPEPMAPQAFHGLAGGFVRTVEQYSEADPQALLGQFLVAFGSAVGRGPHFCVESTPHRANLFLLLVGRSSVGAKGTSWDHVERIFTLADPGWAKGATGEEERLAIGLLSSGEGLIYPIRDETYEYDKKQRAKVLSDPGVGDKRLCVLQTEFAGALRVLERDGNTLGTVIKQAWDGKKMRVLTKTSRVAASNPHVSIVGHIVEEELHRYLNATDAAGGLANRFLPCCSQRARSLPDGARLPDEVGEHLGQKIFAALVQARKIGEMGRDDAARRLWHEVYEGLRERPPGMFGTVTGRGAAYVLRLSMIYALLDGSAVIQEPHLRAALAGWRYCEDSARYLFGESLGDPTADPILRALRANPEGVPRTGLRDLFSRHRPGEVERALALLLERGLARFERRDTGGRPEERWFAVGRSA